MEKKVFLPVMSRLNNSCYYVSLTKENRKQKHVLFPRTKETVFLQYLAVSNDWSDTEQIQIHKGNTVALEQKSNKNE